jgi:outer membrane protein OmpA-like peptidoglycan-associated protein
MRAVLLALALGALAAPALHAQSSPSTQQMIDELRPAPRTRSLSRNLQVEAVSRPSLSLLVQFGFDSAEVLPESEQALQNLAGALQSSELAASRFAIEGHTDARGRRDYNVRLSQRRADAVRDVLARHGVDTRRLVTAGKGPDEPADPSDPMAAANRRVRVVNLD